MPPMPHGSDKGLRGRTNDYTVTPEQFIVLAYAALGALTLIVLTGAAVRLTGSGLGCPTWPKCYGHVYPPLNTHAVIEFSNRVLTVPVSIAAGAAWLGACAGAPTGATCCGSGHCCRWASSGRPCWVASPSKGPSTTAG